jgi:hypothetical protein
MNELINERDRWMAMYHKTKAKLETVEAENEWMKQEPPWDQVMYLRKDKAAAISQIRDLRAKQEAAKAMLVEDAALIAQTKAELAEAIARIKDMLIGDDGQAWKEAKKFIARLEKP